MPLLSALLLGVVAAAASAQQPATPAQGAANTPTTTSANVKNKPAGAESQPAEQGASISGRDRRRAAKLFLQASKLFEKEQFESALHDYEQASALDPTNRDYSMAVLVARSHLVTALIQKAAK
ncbi:MAG: hypothetical protein WCA11_06050, partial [Terracidiphilus sp.]